MLSKNLNGDPFAQYRNETPGQTNSEGGFPYPYGNSHSYAGYPYGVYGSEYPNLKPTENNVYTKGVYDAGVYAQPYGGYLPYGFDLYGSVYNIYMDPYVETDPTGGMPPSNDDSNDNKEIEDLPLVEDEKDPPYSHLLEEIGVLLEGRETEAFEEVNLNLVNISDQLDRIRGAILSLTQAPERNHVETVELAASPKTVQVLKGTFTESLRAYFAERS